ncbi:hypothetical protein [Sphingosinicella sp. CPCC 101087]|uniref:hypothetical protein n=1 Tax=Sphingosinicella sp. CPCC 101087 TaxID=2497754 RepID=UPI00101B78D2|nr:hypothetical protein [Sphingosinicella sp. CPCC 101087]
MRFFSRRSEPAEPAAAPATGRSYEVGWLFKEEKGSVIWDAPQPVRQEPAPNAVPKSVAFCPAVIEFDRRHFVISCPIDIHLRLGRTPDGKLNMTNVLGERGSVRPATLNSMLVNMPQQEWRHPERPVIQIATPYLFVSDDPVYINQFPPFLHYSAAPRPGVQLCGRFPIDVWPRILMWAFEWHDLSKDLILKRGEPWFYVRFEGPDPSASVRLVEAQMTEELKSYAASITDVANYVNRTYSLFKTARERRPERLLVPKARG